MEQAIFTNMVMITDSRGYVLMERRCKGSWTGLAFPGGHVEPGEAFTASAERELFEETGLEVHNLHLCGIKQFQSEEGARYVVFLFRGESEGGVLCSSSEGEVFWINPQELKEEELAPSFSDMLACFMNESLQELHYIPAQPSEHSNGYRLVTYTYSHPSGTPN